MPSPFTAIKRRAVSLVNNQHALIPGAIVLGLTLLVALWALHFTRIQNEKHLALQAALESSQNIATIVATNLEEVLGLSALYANLAGSYLQTSRSDSPHLNPQ